MSQRQTHKLWYAKIGEIKSGETAIEEDDGKTAMKMEKLSITRVVRKEENFLY